MRLIDADELKASLGEPPENWTSSPEEIQALNDFYSFQDLIDAQLTVNQWIPCSERLPQEVKGVICSMNDGTVTELCLCTSPYKNDAEHYYWEDPTGEYYYAFKEVYAWKPLPEPWRGEEHDKG